MYAELEPVRKLNLKLLYCFCTCVVAFDLVQLDLTLKNVSLPPGRT